MSLWIISVATEQIVDGVSDKQLFTETRIAADTQREMIFAGALVSVLAPAAVDDVELEWLEVDYASTLVNDNFRAETRGWMLKKYLGKPLEQKSHPVDVERFTRDCAFVEMASATGGGEAETTVLAADYLIALAMIETRLTTLGTQLPGTDAIGPFQITSAEWTAFLESGVDDRIGPGQRFVPAYQIQCADFMTKRDWAAFVAAATPPATNGEPVAPSYLNLFQARLIGPAAAAEVARVAAAAGGGERAVDVAMRRAGVAAAEIDLQAERRAEWLKKNGAWRTVADFNAHTEKMLRDGLVEGRALLVKHFPEFAIVPLGAAPWFDVASKEMKDWETPSEKLSEKSEAGKNRITKKYFMATSHHPDKVEHWCGAFIAYCLGSCSDQAIAESVVPGAAKAANWRNWGNVDLTTAPIATVPKGAVVTLTKTGDSGPSGHVTFFVRLDGDGNHFVGLGGNQSDTVKESSYPIARIAAIRWLNVEQDVREIDFSRGAGNIAAISEADKAIMTKTLWGEASGETDEGVKAVAAVILNRLASSRYPSTLAGVCRQSKQFSCWNSNDPNRAKIDALSATDPGLRKLRGIVDQVIAAGPQSVLPANVLHYHTTTISADWSKGEPVFKRIGNHNFYANIA